MFTKYDFLKQGDRTTLAKLKMMRKQHIHGGTRLLVCSMRRRREILRAAAAADPAVHGSVRFVSDKKFKGSGLLDGRTGNWD